MATMMIRKAVVVVGCLLCVCGVAAPEDKVDATTCKATFQSTDHIELCHGQSNSRGPYSCSGEWRGFVLEQLVIAPRSESYVDCGPFHNNYLYGAQCLRDIVRQRDDFDRAVFDILDKVSGQNQIAKSTVVERFSLERSAQEKDKETDHFPGNSSAFVSFQKKCKPAYLDLSVNKATMINVCSEQTVNESRVYLTLRDTRHVPVAPSTCRCTIRPTVSARLLALDVRLQSSTNHNCGPTAMKIQSKGNNSIDLKCEGLSAWYGSTLLYSSDGEITLTLSPVSATSFPTSVWIEVVEKGDANTDWEPVTVSCEGFIPIPDKTDNGNSNSGGGVGGESEEQGGNASAAGDSMRIIIGAVIGGLLLIVIIIVIIVIVKRRRSGSYSGVLPVRCGSCCKGKGGKGKTSYKTVAQMEPVYSEPGKPRPSNSAPPYTFPVDAKIIERGGSEYAEPDPNGTLGLAARATTPPPLPDSPPPSSPPAVVFSAEEPPPKPVRTFPRPRKESAKSNSDEEYDHIMMSRKGLLKSAPDRDGQNNIIGESNEGEGTENLYNRLDHGDDYSQIGTVPKTVIKDNIYDTTD